MDNFMSNFFNKYADFSLTIDGIDYSIDGS